MLQVYYFTRLKLECLNVMALMSHNHSFCNTTMITSDASRQNIRSDNANDYPSELETIDLFSTAETEINRR